MQAVTAEEGYLLVALDSDGAEVGRLAGRYLGRLPDGTVMVSQAGALSRASRTLLFNSHYPFPGSNRMASIATSPVDDRWAIWEIEEATGVAAPAQLWIVEDGDIIIHFIEDVFHAHDPYKSKSRLPRPADTINRARADGSFREHQ